MGEIADAIVDGEICQICCGNPPDVPQGYPFTCGECDDRVAPHRPHADDVPFDGPDDLLRFIQNTKTTCDECGKTLKTKIGLAQHKRDKHGE